MTAGLPNQRKFIWCFPKFLFEGGNIYFLKVDLYLNARRYSLEIE